MLKNFWYALAASNCCLSLLCGRWPVIVIESWLTLPSALLSDYWNVGDLLTRWICNDTHTLFNLLLVILSLMSLLTTKGFNICNRCFSSYLKLHWLIWVTSIFIRIPQKTQLPNLVHLNTPSFNISDKHFIDLNIY